MNKREMIFKAALPLFDELGFAGTTTAKIAKEAGIGAGTLFLYFKTKEDLIVDLYFEIRKEIKLIIDTHLTTDTYSKDSLKICWDALSYWGVTNQDKYSFFQQFSYSTYFRNLAKQRSSMGYDSLLECFRSLLKEDVSISIAITSFYGLNFAFTYGLLFFDSSFRPIFESESFNVFWNGISHLLKDS